MGIGASIIEADAQAKKTNPFLEALKRRKMTAKDEPLPVIGSQAYADEGSEQKEAQYSLLLEFSSKVHQTVRELTELSKDPQFSPETFMSKARGMMLMLQTESINEAKLIEAEHLPILEVTRNEAAKLVPVIDQALRNIDIANSTLAARQIGTLAKVLDLLDDFNIDLSDTLDVLEGKFHLLKVDDPEAFRIFEKVEQQNEFVAVYNRIPAPGAASRRMSTFLATEVEPFLSTLFNQKSDVYQNLYHEARGLENLYGAEIQTQVDIDPMSVKQDNRGVIELFQKILAYHIVYDRWETSQNLEELRYLTTESGRDLIVNQFVMGELRKIKTPMIGDELIEVTKSIVTRALITLKLHSEVIQDLSLNKLRMSSMKTNEDPEEIVDRLRPRSALQKLKQATKGAFRGLRH